MEDALMDRYRLRFPDDLERIYQDESFHHSLKQLRISIIVVALVYALFGILDALVTPDVEFQAWFIRFAIVVPASLFVIIFSFSSHFKKYQQITVSALALVGGGGLVALIVITNMSASYFHFAGLLLVIMTTYTSFKLRFLYATITCWTIIALYEISALWISHTPLRVFLTDNFFYISANLMGMFTNYQRELYARKEFLQMRRMQEMEQQKHAREKERLHETVEKAARSLTESEDRFRTLAETTTAAIIIHRGGTFLYTNPAVQKITGYTTDELLGMDFWAIVIPAYRDVVRERGRMRISGGEAPGEYEFKILTKSGEERWATTTAGFIEYEGTPAIIATLFDITDRKRAEDEKMKIYEERIQEEKRHLAEKEAILMELHDGVGGITTNIGILSELAQKSTDREKIQKTLATISQLSREGVSEIRGIMRSIDISEMSWHTLAAEIRIQGTNMLEPHSIAFSLDTSIDIVAVEQPGSLVSVNVFKICKEAFTNIIKHAQATSVKSTLSIAGSGLTFTVSDNGIGFTEKSCSGRGLSNMRKRASELGGEVLLSFGNGTRLDLKIPLPIQGSVYRNQQGL
jgi:PAS domain S-box-containing protein